MSAEAFILLILLVYVRFFDEYVERKQKTVFAKYGILYETG